MDIVGETIVGSGTSFTLAYSPIPNSQAIYGLGIRLVVGTDYSITGSAITILIGTYNAGGLTGDYTTMASVAPSSTLSPYALTTLQRVKDRLFDPSNLINVVGNTTINSALVSSAVFQTGKILRVGQTVQGLTIPFGTTIVSLTATTMLLSQNAFDNATGTTIYVVDQPVAYNALLVRMINFATNYLENECGRSSFVRRTYVHDTYSISSPRQSFLQLRNTPVFPASDGVHITSFQWRAGTPSNPNWVDFIPDQYELVDPRTDPTSGLIWYPTGIVRVYGVLPRIYNNMIRATYDGGYPVDWANAENHITHWLPGDITDVCENLVLRRFARRNLAGKSSQSLEGATHSWRNLLDQEDVIGQYRLVNW